jgi:hypothetical protein
VSKLIFCPSFNATKMAVPSVDGDWAEAAEQVLGDKAN